MSRPSGTDFGLSGLWERAARAYLLYALAFAGTSAWLALRLHHRVLFLDQWRIDHDLFTRPFLEAIWRPVAGHRIAVPNLFFYVANAVFSGDNAFLVVVALAVFAASAWMLCGAVRRWEGCDAGAKRLSMGMVLITLFWFGNQLTLVWGAAGLPCALPVAGTLAALVATARAQQASAAGRRSEVAWTGLAVLCAAVATYSSGQGPAVWPALILVSLLGRPRWHSAALFLTCGAAAISVYALAGPGALTRHPAAADGGRLLRAAASTSVLLGALPAHLFGFAVESGSRGSLILAGGSGGAGALLAASAVVGLGLRRRRLEYSAAVILGFIAYSAAVAGTTGFVRSSTFEVSNSLVPRYAVWSSLFWTGLLCLLPPAVAWTELRWGRRNTRLAVASAAVGLAALAWPSHRHWVGLVAERTQRSDEAALSLVDGVDDPDPQRRHLFKRLDKVHATASELRKRRWNLFRHDWSRLTGVRLEDRHRELDEPRRVWGGFSLAAISESAPEAGWRMEGWAWDPQAGGPPRFVVVVDASGVVRGVGRFTRSAPAELRAVLPPGEPLTRALRLVHPLVPASLGLEAGWFGYVQGGTDVRALRVLAVLDDGRSVARLDATAP